MLRSRGLRSGSLRSGDLCAGVLRAAVLPPAPPSCPLLPSAVMRARFLLPGALCTGSLRPSSRSGALRPGGLRPGGLRPVRSGSVCQALCSGGLRPGVPGLCSGGLPARDLLCEAMPQASSPARSDLLGRELLRPGGLRPVRLVRLGSV